MDRNIKYKTICRVGIYGDDDINTLSNSQYNIYPSSITGITVVNGGSNYSHQTLVCGAEARLVRDCLFNHLCQSRPESESGGPSQTRAAI